jgi:hypothetical protein
MTGRRSNPFAGLAFGQDPLDDPLVAGWDAVVARDPAALPSDDSEDVVLLRRFHALDTVPLPTPGFFSDLERQLAALPPAPPAMQKGVDGSRIASFRIARPAPGSRSSLKLHRWTPMHSALSVLAVLLVLSLLVLYQAVPGPAEPPPIPAAVIAKPSIEPISQFEFWPSMWDTPDATTWNHMEIGMFSVAPATSFTTDLPFYTSGDGPLLLTVLSGQLTVSPVGSALFYPANQFSQPPVEVSAGSSVSIGPNDTVVYSATETGTGSNSGSEPAIVLYALVGALEHELGSSVRPADVSFINYEYFNPIPSMPTEGAAITLQRLELAPFDTFVFEPDADLRYLPFVETVGLRIAEGALEGLVPQSGTRGIYGAVNLRYLPPGPHTIFNLGDETVSIYFLVVEPTPVAATPTP